MTTLLLGANGQLGRHLRTEIASMVTCARSRADHSLDLSDIESVPVLLDRVRPDVIVNAAAWTAVDDAEDHESEAFRLNHDLPAALAEWCRGHEALLVHYSTDYVFSGEPGRPWREEDPVAPESAYGRTKLAGEQAIATSGCRALVLRTAWVYSALPGNFVSAILNRAGEGQDLKVVADQTGSPTWAGTLAQATRRLLSRGEVVDRPELLHVAGQGAMTWYDLAGRAVQLAAERGIIPGIVDVEPIGSDQWPQKAQRPAWSVLDGSRYEQFTGRPLPDCEQALAECLDQWSNVPC
ncbi:MULTISPECIES: dTDP-4-dehydrorhamnose reductase [unclassified Wenzhouxiangella]|uniref:dTDP-4-dehydrorhamnose reductase n=1 Tax=unclassified Wenzhouxiangella TaxID=2613841 RepID=UPI000E328C40|nr:MULTISPECIES: dTDP-4-dehydrorhamnose reductase [unclassified Wenzhouxiangella]RFF27835.1 dTDP-4-dehydrorhamnose reductase [Wenzhouxiangella sp. 15181]RFP70320.1 dTDP-4-dehydrorhamnose reductase [Wenzhouxiangella sp. 15190]